MYILYILKSSNNHLYIGTTSDLTKRVERHKRGSGAEFTKRNKVFQTVYTERFSTLVEARRREKQIKGWRRGKKIIL